MGGIRFEPNGEVTIITGTLDYGQGHASPFAQVLTAQLGVPFEKIRLLQGDSDKLIAGGGTGGSRSMMQSGGAIIAASDIVIERGKHAAAHFLEAAAADIEFSRGRFVIAGTDRSIRIMDLVERLRLATHLPEDVPRTLDVSHVFKGVPSAFPNGCHVAEIELDPDTGVVEIVSYVTVNDFGVLVNPMLVEGQAHGGIAQGIGQALMDPADPGRSGDFVCDEILAGRGYGDDRDLWPVSAGSGLLASLKGDAAERADPVAGEQDHRLARMRELARLRHVGRRQNVRGRTLFDLLT